MTFSLPRGGAMGPRFGDNASSRLDRRGDRGSSAASRARRAGSRWRAIVALAAAGGASAASVAVSRNAVARRALLAGAAVAIPALFDVGAALAKAKGKGGQGSPPTKAVAPTPVTNGTSPVGALSPSATCTATSSRPCGRSSWAR